nr:MAG: 5-formyltetrahydrofolate cyclo-ligase [Bacillota bacterium]
MRQEKAALRQEMLARREALDPAAWAEASRRLQAHLLASPLYRRARTILFYWAVRREPGTQEAIRQALAEGKRVVLPRAVRWQGEAPTAPAPAWGGGGRGLALHLYRGPGDLVPGPYGLWEPDPAAPAVTPGELDLVLVPGVAFDRRGGRLGHGGGYYDRFLPHVPPGVPRVGCCFGFQVVAAVPRGPHDRPVTHLLTEDGLFPCAPEGSAPAESAPEEGTPEAGPPEETGPLPGSPD